MNKIFKKLNNQKETREKNLQRNKMQNIQILSGIYLERNDYVQPGMLSINKNRISNSIKTVILKICKIV